MTTSQPGGPGAADIEIGNRITSTLAAKGLNQRDLSDATGIPYPTLRRSLKGSRSLTFLEFNKIADAVQADPRTLLPAKLTGNAA